MAAPKRTTAPRPPGAARGPSGPSGLRKPPPDPPSRRNLWIGLAAVVVVVAIAAFIVLRPKHRTSVDLISPRPEGVQTGTMYAWHPMEGIATYEIEIITESGDPVFATSVRDTSIQAPAEKFEAGKRYLWLVRAIVNGESKTASRIDRFTYQP